MNGFYNGVKIWNKTPINRPKGGRLLIDKTMNKQQRLNDSIRAIVRPGEMIIPVSYKRRNIVPMVVKFLKQNKIFLPNT